MNPALLAWRRLHTMKLHDNMQCDMHLGEEGEGVRRHGQDAASRPIVRALG